MAKTTKIRDIDIFEQGGTFSTFFRKITGEQRDYNFEGLHTLRQLLNNEKAKILYMIKSKKPSSIYHLSKLLNRDFKSVNEDVKLLEKFGFIDLISEKTGKRERLKPVLVVDAIQINIRV